MSEREGGHVVRLVQEPKLRCFSCGATWPPSDWAAAAVHLANGGPRLLAEAPMYPCAEVGCDRSFASEQGRNVHAARAHRAEAGQR